MSPVVLILAVIICITVAMFVHVWSMALAGWLVGAEIQEVSIGFGPSMLRIKTGTASININYIPTGGSVKFGDSFHFCSWLPGAFMPSIYIIWNS